MNPRDTVHHQPDSHAAATDATLRLIAGLPAPEGLEERVHAALRSAHRRGRILAWPSRFSADSPWRRGAAAAAIAFVVVGGGWGVYSRVQPNKVIAMPRITNQGGFNGANAVNVPKTLNGPVLTHPELATPAVTAPNDGKTAPHVVRMPSRKDQKPASTPSK